MHVQSSALCLHPYLRPSLVQSLDPLKHGPLLGSLFSHVLGGVVGDFLYLFKDLDPSSDVVIQTEDQV